MSIATKVFLAFTVVAVTFGLTSTYSVWQMRRLHKNRELMEGGHLRIMLALTEAGGDLKSFDSVLDERDPILLEKALTVARSLYPFPAVVRRHVVAARRAAGKALASDPSQPARAELQEIAEELAKLEQGLLDLEAGSGDLLLEVEQRDPNGIDEVRQRLKQRSRSLQVRVRRLTTTLHTALARSADDADADERRAVWLVILLATLAMAITVGVTFVAGLALRPMRRLTEAVKEVSEGGEARRVEVSGSDEVGVLAAEFNHMVESLEQRDRALRHAERLATIGRMSAQVAHEVRNPLMSIGLNVELLEEELASLASADGGQEAKALLGSVQREVERLTEVTENYLTLARLPSPDLDAGDVNEILEDLLGFLGEELARKDIGVDRDLQEHLPSVRLDGNQLRQAFMNLVRNSAEAMDGGGKLSVRTRQEGDGVGVAIADTGHGIEASLIDRIFDPLFSTKTGGTGIGLAVTRQIVQGHGGSIECVSLPGEGTTFHVHLPSTPDDRAAGEA